MPARDTLCCDAPFFFFNDTATTEIYTLSLHDALPIWSCCRVRRRARWRSWPCRPRKRSEEHTSELQSHSFISYAVFCLKKNSTPGVVVKPRRRLGGGLAPAAYVIG